MTDESKRRIAELAEALAVNESNPSALEMYYRAFPNIQHREWDKFPQAFKDHLARTASHSAPETDESESNPDRLQSQLMEIVAAKQAAKERGEFQVEVPPPDKFNRAFEEFLANKASDSK